MILIVHMFQCVIAVKFIGATQLVRSIYSLPTVAIMSSQTLEPWILTTSNYLDWRIDMHLALRNHGYHRIIHGWEHEPHQPVERNKFLNRCDEVFRYLCTYISRDILFHLEGLRTPRESWEKLDSLFNKQYELRGHILENELVSLHPSSFETIEQLFTKFKSLILQCRQCGIEWKDEQNVLSILNKLCPEHSVFVSIFHSKQEIFPDWKVPS